LKRAGDTLFEKNCFEIGMEVLRKSSFLSASNPTGIQKECNWIVGLFQYQKD